jgi:hypothetical protein
MLLPSNTSTNVLANPSNVEASPSNVILSLPETITENDYEKPFILITSMILCNKVGSNIGVFAKIVNDSTTAHLLYNLNLPPGVSFDVIQGNKFTLKEGDELTVWHNGAASDSLDLTLSYTLHRPLTTYDI